MRIYEYSIRLYGLCGIGVKKGVVRGTIDFIPGSSIVGALVSSLMMYGGYDLNAEVSDNLASRFIKALKEKKLLFLHLIPKRNDSVDLFKQYLNFWVKKFFTGVYDAVRKIVVPHLAVQRAVGCVLTYENKESKEYKGALYGDEVMIPPYREFYGYIVLKDGSLKDLIKKIMPYLNLSRIGMRSKYCIPELVKEPTLLNVNVDSVFKGDSEDEVFVAPLGLAFEAHEINEVNLKILNAKIQFIKVSESSYGGFKYISIYRLLSLNGDKVILALPPSIVKIKDLSKSLSELFFIGLEEMKFTSLGWNKLLPYRIFLELREGK